MTKNKEEKTTEKYVKVNPYYYQEYRDEGRPFNWFKKTERLYAELYDIQPILSVALKGEEEKFSLRKEEPAAGEGEAWVSVRDESAKALYTEGKAKTISNAFRAKAVFQDRRVNLIENGQIARHPYYESAEFHCKEGDGIGSLMHNDGEVLNYDRSHSKPYISIEAYLPAELFQAILQQIREEKINNVLVCLKCDVFQSEVERSLAEPWMTQDYTIEAGSYDNMCGIEWIQVGGKKYAPQPKNGDELAENDDSEASQNNVTPELQMASLLVKELRRTNRMLKTIAIALAIITVLFFLGFGR